MKKSFGNLLGELIVQSIFPSGTFESILYQIPRMLEGIKNGLTADQTDDPERQFNHQPCSARLVQLFEAPALSEGHSPSVSTTFCTP